MHLPPRSKGKIEVHAERSALARRVGMRALTFIHTAEAGGAVLFLSALLAMLWANSPWGESYFSLFHTPIEVRIGDFSLAPPSEQPGHLQDGGHGDAPESAVEGGASLAEHEPSGEGTGANGDTPASEADEEGEGHTEPGMTLHHWINDGLMVLFFFVVGLEIKRELVLGELAGFRRAILPAAIALGGMVVPALIYVGINAAGTGGSMRGWGVPMATDIAFAVGVLALLGNRVPNSVRVLLLAFAIVDDIGAILVIALFYTEEISGLALLLTALLLGVVYLMRRIGVLDVFPYFLVGALVWACMLSSGVHATIAGVVLGLMTPSGPLFSMKRYAEQLNLLKEEYNEAVRENDEEAASFALSKIETLTQGTESVLDRLVRLVHPWTAFVILPIFALSNAGVAIDRESLSVAFSSPVLWGVALGLILGKPIGTTLMAWVCVKLGLASLPVGTSFRQIFGIGLLGAIGFTVALFITDLAFADPALTDSAKLGILLASLIAGIAGLLFLRTTLPVSSPNPTSPTSASHH